MLPEKRKASLAGLTSLEIVQTAPDDQRDTIPPLDLQAFHLRRRFGLSGVLARAVAELAYNAGGVA